MNETVPSEEELTLRVFVERTIQEHERTKEELREITVLVKQSSAEVVRLEQRTARVGNYLRQLQTNFDTIPRKDIKEGFEALINAQQRLFTMRGQLEKLQSNEVILRRLVEYQRKIIETTAGLTEVPVAPKPKKDQTNVIRVIQSEEVARQSLVRRMHDGPASSLSNFILQAEICMRLFDMDQEQAREELENLKSSAARTFNAVKNFIFDLRPMMLDDLGVTPTLRRYVESFEEKQGIAVSITVTGVERRIEDHIEVTIFRAVQELMNNAKVHGGATEIEVLLDMDKDRVTAAVKDNGSGFNVDEALADSAKQTVGLPSLKERVEMLGGELSFESRLGIGTRVQITIPVEISDKLLIAV
ncbi:MAG: sensor histidine kinase [Anaerolineae bacterium]|nr:MAG: sensor histidine kinase [Anaerolineae bacterium]